MRLLAAQAIAREAGALARRRFVDKSFKVGFKGPQDYLTEVDGETEELIASRLIRRLSAGRVHRRGDEGARRRDGRRGVGRRSDRRHGQFRPRRRRISASRSPASPAAGSKSASSTIRCATNCSRRAAAAARGSTARRCSASRARIARQLAVEVGWNMRAGAANISTSCGRVVAAGRLAVSHRLRRARHRLCRGRTARRLCRASHQRVGLSRRDSAGQRGRRLRQRFSERRRPRKGNPLIACAPGSRTRSSRPAAMEGIAL